MKYRCCIACVSVVFLGVVVAAQEAEPNGSASALKDLADFYKDKRTVEQIIKDNLMIWAASRGNVERVRREIKNGALVDSRYLDADAFLDEGSSGYTALMLASRAGHEEVVKVLIEAKANLDLERRGRTALEMAVMRDTEPVVKLLVKGGAKGDPKQIRLTHELMRAACRGFTMRKGEGYPLYPGFVRDPAKAPEIADVLKRGAAVNAADSQGYTALMYAANLGLVENVKLLLVSGADATLKSKDGETALSLTERPNSSVAREERRAVVEILKAHLAKKK